MVRLLLNHVPTSVVIVGMMLVCGLVGWMISFLFKRYLPKFLLVQDPHDARESIHLTSVLCALLLTFMIVLLWEAYATLQESVVSEAKTIGALEIFSESLPPENDHEISALIEDYVHVLIHDEWPQMEVGQVSSRATELLLDLRYAIEAIEGKTPTLSAYRHEMLQDYNDVVFARNLRLDHLDSTIPDFFLFTILANLLGMYILMCLLNPSSHKRSHVFFLILTSMMLGLNFSFLVVLDYPFSGELSITNTPLTHIHFD